ncbi:MAG: PEP-CTERM sorting domain-containing protein [Planctomycetes bacterium]|nr:PEP-CTERM sorting domain-containing protein [Planctomycetota bacterium]
MQGPVTGRRILALCLGALTLVGLSADGMVADAAAATLIVNPGGGGPRLDHTGTVGMVFRTGGEAVVATSLGIWDQDGDGLGAAHDVGLFGDAVGGAELGRATIQAGTASTLAGEFRFEPIRPVLLAPNTYYTIGAHYPGPSGTDPFRDQNPWVAFDVTGLDSAANTRAARWSAGAALSYPNSQASLNTSYVGANVQLVDPSMPVNLAVTGTATGSTQAYGSIYADGNDGNRDGMFGNGSVWHTNDPDTSTFYQVDLGGDFHVDRIQIAPRRDAAQGTIENFRLTVFEDDGGGNPGAVAWTNDYLPGVATNFSWGTSDPAGAMGRFVKMERLDSSPTFLSFAEFEVYGNVAPLGPNLATGKTVDASPGGWGSAGSDAVDGDIDGHFYNPGFPIYHSNATAVGQFWEVDLGDRYTMDYVDLFGRTDGGSTTQYRVSLLTEHGAEVATAFVDHNVAATVQDHDHAVDFTGMTGRFLRVETSRAEFLTLAEVRAFGSVAPESIAPMNIAPGGTASGLSAAYGSSFEDGIDGRRDGAFGAGSVWHSLDNTNEAPWYEVDLGKDFYIDRIQIAPRTDMRQGSVKDFRLTVFEDDGSGNAGAVVWSGDYLPGSTADYYWGTTDPGGAMGRHVRIERLGGTPVAAPPFLAFAELEIYGSETPLGENVALGKPVTASPAGFGTTIGAGNDGDIDGDFYNPGFPVYHSNGSAAGQFWQVDLESEYELDYVELFGRTDGGNTSQFLVSVLDGAGSLVASELIDSDVFATHQQFDHLLDFRGLDGQFVRVETTRPEFLAFAELRVFTTVVPEPSTIALAILGAGGLLVLNRRRKKR